MRVNVSESRTTDAGSVTERNVAYWNELFSLRPRWSRYPSEELTGFIARRFPDREQRRTLKALDIGCGPGTDLWFLTREGFAIAGMDGAATAIELARERFRAEGLLQALAQADLRVGDFSTLPWDDASFDLVIDIQAISHNTLPKIRSTIAEIWRVLKPGGRFFARMFGDQTTGILSGVALEDRTTYPDCGPLVGGGLVHAFTEDELITLLSAFQELNTDWVLRRLYNKFDVFEWVVEARKIAPATDAPATNMQKTD
jgi:SAM-dependent methyltransferase